MPEPISHQDQDKTNLAVSMDKETRREWADMVVREYDLDVLGRREWERKRDEYYRLWLGERKPKTDPWPGCSNVCLPIMAVAANQFHARSLTSFFSPPEYVQVLPVEANDVGRAKRVQDYMNWQTMHEMEEFEDEHDKLLGTVPVSGADFTKVIYDRELNRPTSLYISGIDVVLPYRTRNIAKARRVQQRVWKHFDEIKREDKAKRNFYVDLDSISNTGHTGQERAEIQETADSVETRQFDNQEKPKLFIESHKWVEDPKTGRLMPVVLTVDYDSKTLLRATERKINDKVVNFIVDYHFIPNPHGFYGLGFGHFLKDLNEMANTAFNQIFDAGRLSNQPFGFYGSRAGLRRREIKLQPGKMYEVSDAGQVVFPQMQRVDQVLFQVLGLIQGFTERFTSTSDLLLGREQKGVRDPTATGTLALIEQGLILYSVMIKRLFRSYRKELDLLFLMDSFALPDEKPFRVLGPRGEFLFPKIKRSDFKKRLDVVPVGDPSFASRTAKKQEADETYQFVLTNPLLGAVDPNVQIKNPRAVREVTKDWLESRGKKNIGKLLPDVPDESVPPEVENSMFAQGDPVDPKPGEDHQMHLRVHEEFKQTGLYEKMSKEQKDLLEEHERKTLTLQRRERFANDQFGGNGRRPLGVTPNA